jgi:hypothetical protein
VSRLSRNNPPRAIGAEKEGVPVIEFKAPKTLAGIQSTSHDPGLGVESCRSIVEFGESPLGRAADSCFPGFYAQGRF